MTDPSTADLAKALGDTQTAVNILWTLVAGFLVMFMQAGFALVETGLVRAKNVAHTMGMNFLVYSIGVLGFWAVGFGLQMGGVGTVFGDAASLTNEYTISIAGHTFGLFGTKGFFLTSGAFTAGVATTFLFQMVFMDTTATIPTGAMAERWKFSGFVVFSFFIAAIIYPIFANWTWGTGWLSQLGANFGLGHGHIDFAGSSVVHLTGGVIAFVGAKLLGPRIGKYDEHGNAKVIPGHNMSMVAIGTFILAFGWFGFNAGSTLSVQDGLLAIVAVNTMLASAAGAFLGYVWSKVRFGKPDVSLLCNGMLAGLVAITAPCAFVDAPIAILIGAISGVLVIEAALFIEKKLKVDDPVGAIAVHGVNGAFGVLAVGLFANGSTTYGLTMDLNNVKGPVTGLFYGGGASQLFAESIGVLANLAWVGGTAFVFYKLVDKVVGMRVPAQDEIDGLDIPEMGVQGYAAEPGKVIPPEMSAAVEKAGVALPAMKVSEEPA